MDVGGGTHVGTEHPMIVHHLECRTQVFVPQNVVKNLKNLNFVDKLQNNVHATNKGRVLDIVVRCVMIMVVVVVVVVTITYIMMIEMVVIVMRDGGEIITVMMIFVIVVLLELTGEKAAKLKK